MISKSKCKKYYTHPKIVTSKYYDNKNFKLNRISLSFKSKLYSNQNIQLNGRFNARITESIQSNITKYISVLKSQIFFFFQIMISRITKPIFFSPLIFILSQYKYSLNGSYRLRHILDNLFRNQIYSHKDKIIFESNIRIIKSIENSFYHNYLQQIKVFFKSQQLTGITKYKRNMTESILKIHNLCNFNKNEGNLQIHQKPMENKALSVFGKKGKVFVENNLNPRLKRNLSLKNNEKTRIKLFNNFVFADISNKKNSTKNCSDKPLDFLELILETDKEFYSIPEQNICSDIFYSAQAYELNYNKLENNNMISDEQDYKKQKKPLPIDDSLKTTTKTDNNHNILSDEFNTLTNSKNISEQKKNTKQSYPWLRIKKISESLPSNESLKYNNLIHESKLKSIEQNREDFRYSPQEYFRTPKKNVNSSDSHSNYHLKYRDQNIKKPSTVFSTPDDDKGCSLDDIDIVETWCFNTLNPNKNQTNMKNISHNMDLDKSSYNSNICSLSPGNLNISGEVKTFKTIENEVFTNNITPNYKHIHDNIDIPNRFRDNKSLMKNNSISNNIKKISDDYKDFYTPIVSPKHYRQCLLGLDSNNHNITGNVFNKKENLQNTDINRNYPYTQQRVVNNAASPIKRPAPNNDRINARRSSGGFEISETDNIDNTIDEPTSSILNNFLSSNSKEISQPFDLLTKISSLNKKILHINSDIYSTLRNLQRSKSLCINISNCNSENFKPFINEDSQPHIEYIDKKCIIPSVKNSYLNNESCKSSDIYNILSNKFNNQQLINKSPGHKDCLENHNRRIASRNTVHVYPSGQSLDSFNVVEKNFKNMFGSSSQYTLEKGINKSKDYLTQYHVEEKGINLFEIDVSPNILHQDTPKFNNKKQRVFSHDTAEFNSPKIAPKLGISQFPYSDGNNTIYAASTKKSKPTQLNSKKKNQSRYLKKNNQIKENLVYRSSAWENNGQETPKTNEDINMISQSKKNMPCYSITDLPSNNKYSHENKNINYKLKNVEKSINCQNNLQIQRSIQSENLVSTKMKLRSNSLKSPSKTTNCLDIAREQQRYSENIKYFKHDSISSEVITNDITSIYDKCYNESSKISINSPKKTNYKNLLLSPIKSNESVNNHRNTEGQEKFQQESRIYKTPPSIQSHPRPEFCHRSITSGSTPKLSPKATTRWESPRGVKKQSEFDCLLSNGEITESSPSNIFQLAAKGAASGLVKYLDTDITVSPLPKSEGDYFKVFLTESLNLNDYPRGMVVKVFSTRALFLYSENKLLDILTHAIKQYNALVIDQVVRVPYIKNIETFHIDGFLLVEYIPESSNTLFLDWSRCEDPRDLNNISHTAFKEVTTWLQYSVTGSIIRNESLLNGKIYLVDFLEEPLYGDELKAHYWQCLRLLSCGNPAVLHMLKQNMDVLGPSSLNQSVKDRMIFEQDENDYMSVNRLNKNMKVASLEKKYFLALQRSETQNNHMCSHMSDLISERDWDSPSSGAVSWLFDSEESSQSSESSTDFG